MQIEVMTRLNDDMFLHVMKLWSGTHRGSIRLIETYKKEPNVEFAINTTFELKSETTTLREVKQRLQPNQL